MGNFDIANSDVADLFKTVYPDYMAQMFNDSHPVLSMIKRDMSASGNVQAHGIRFSLPGGVGSGSIPTGNAGIYDQTNYTLKQVYARETIDDKSVQLALNNGAFKELVQETVESLQKSNSANWARILFGNGTGKLGEISSVVDDGGGQYTLTMKNTAADPFIRANLRKSMLINIETGNTDLFEIRSVVRSTAVVVVLRKTGTQIPVANDELFMQGSENTDPQGLIGVLDATSSTKYGITIGDGWQSTQVDANSKPISAEMLMDCLISVQDEFGEMPNMIVCGATQRKRLMHLGEEIKYLDVAGDGGKYVMGGPMPHIMLNGAAIPIVYDQHVANDRVLLLNKEHITIRTAGAGHFKDVGGSHLIPEYMNGNDRKMLLYATYGEIYIVPTAHATITDLSTTTLA